VQVKSFTAMLWVIGILSFGSVAALSVGMDSFSVLMAGLPGGAIDNLWVAVTIHAFLLVLAVMCFWAAALRSVGARVAATATSATSLLLGFWFPLGTAASLWWWISVRKRESGPVGA